MPLQCLKYIVTAFLAVVSAQRCSSVKYMPLGDSITDIVCWRAYLWEALQDRGFANINFVGSTRGQRLGGCDVPSWDRDSEGHSGLLATHAVALSLLSDWLRQNPADIVSMHLGSNDIGHGYTTEQILDAFTELVGQMREANPQMKIIVAQILPLSAIGVESRVLELNARIPLWAASLTTYSSPIIIVDQHTGFDADDLRDGLHPNDQGDRKMAANWYPALEAAARMVLNSPAQDHWQLPINYDGQSFD